MSKTEQDFRELLDSALTGIKGLGRSAIDIAKNQYAPVLAQIAAAGTVEEAQADFDDLMVNVEAAAEVLGIEAETQGVDFIQRAVKLAAGAALAALA
jgi:D-arabinose 1-dehydrogenase-like Zn-dependent alcohol dehydrogenase